MMAWEIRCRAGKHTEEMGLKIADGDLGCVPLVESWWDKLHFHGILVANDVFHCFRDFIVENVLPGHYSGAF